MRNTIDTTSRGRALKVAWIGLWMACMPSAWAQEPLVETFLTKDNLLIGEPSLLKIRATYPVGGYTVNWFTLPDSLPHFAVVERGAVDSTVVDGQVRLEQPIKFTSFDSGQWATPRLSVNFIPKAGGQAVSLQTNALPFTVNYVLDTTLVLNDIKPIMQGETEGWPWWWFAVGAAALGLLVLLGWLLYRYLNKKMPAAAPLKISRYEEIIQQLAALRQLDIAQTEPCRQFHTRLASLFKAYMEQPTGVSLSHQTTGDTLLYLKRTLSSEQLAKVADTLRGCDAVKFAKFMPPVAQSHQWLNDIRACIEQMEKREVAG